MQINRTAEQRNGNPDVLPDGLPGEARAAKAPSCMNFVHRPLPLE